jgi:inosine-uridine nucleoside N-ribohydrolase
MIKSHHKQPVPLILDTDMGNDIDDALALAMIHTLQSRGECELLGVVSSKDNPYSPVYIDVVNTFYGRGGIPIGTVRDGATPDDRTFIKPIATARDSGVTRYPRTYQPEQYEDAVPLLRRLLASAAEKSVVIVMIGFSTNMARLLASGSDRHSGRNGLDLFAAKVKRVVAMAGNFSDEVQRNPSLDTREYNIHRDVPAAIDFFTRCPAPITFCGYEVGAAMLYPSDSIDTDYNWAEHHPVAEAYRCYMQMPYERPLWDPATVMEAVRPGSGYFEMSPPGRVTVDGEGIALFRPEPTGPHKYMKISPERVAPAVDEIVSLCTSAPMPRRKPGVSVTQVTGH